MIPGLSVLIVDACKESREVLRTALRHRGLETLEAAHADEGLALAHTKHPDLIVLDVEDAELDETAGEFSCAADHEGASLLIIGNLRNPFSQTASEFVAKPYHYKPLILKIEELLRRQQDRRAA